MSDFKPHIYLSFINRRDSTAINTIPVVNRLTINKDIRQLCDSFDFDVEYRLSEKIDLHSHDFVEFYTMVNGVKEQITAGFIEDITHELTANTIKFQANGRDFLGQLFNLPFLKVKPIDQTKFVSWIEAIVTQSFYSKDPTKYDPNKAIYLNEYLKLKKIPQIVSDQGAYRGKLLIPELSDAKIAPVIQSMADELHNVVYQDRSGQVVIWGETSVDANNTGLTLHDSQDSNVMKFTLKENFSKVFSEVKILVASGEANLDYFSTHSQSIGNTDKKAQQIFQPEVRTFSAPSLVLTAGQVEAKEKMTELAKSIMRKSNQNLTSVIIHTNYPYFIKPSGAKVLYEVNTLYTIFSSYFKINQLMRLVGISYNQDNAQIGVELMFVPKESLV